MSLKERVGGNVKFVRFEDSELWYVCEDGFEFPIPLEDAKGAKFMAEDKGLYFMRWIKKHMTMLEAAKLETMLDKFDPAVHGGEIMSEFVYHPREDGNNVDFEKIVKSFEGNREGTID